MASHRIASRRIASHRIASHRIASHGRWTAVCEVDHDSPLSEAIGVLRELGAKLEGKKSRDEEGLVA